MTSGRLQGKVAIVTGAAGGIGSAISAAFAAEGAKLLCADIDGDGAATTAAAITAAGGTAMGLACDVSRSDSARAVVTAAAERFGALHVLVNNAAVFPPKATIAELEDVDWERALAVNVGGAFHMSKHAIPRIKAAGGGSVIHIASQMGRVGSAGDAAYCATKGALLTLAKAMVPATASASTRCPPAASPPSRWCANSATWRRRNETGAAPATRSVASASLRRSRAPPSFWPAMILRS
jgi:NAD(P)-dependent dehydrogenase (short-subunit alcohol dehydrogenase family)